MTWHYIVCNAKRVGVVVVCELTSVLVAAFEAVDLPAITPPVDERPQLSHVPHTARHHHLLLHDVRLG